MKWQDRPFSIDWLCGYCYHTKTDLPRLIEKHYLPPVNVHLNWISNKQQFHRASHLHPPNNCPNNFVSVRQTLQFAHIPTCYKFRGEFPQGLLFLIPFVELE